MSGQPPAGFALTVDLAVFTIRDGVFRVLLAQRASEPFAGRWALPGGFVRPDESVTAAAWRELSVETGMPRFPGHLEQLRTYGEADRDPRMRVVSVAHLAFAPDLPDPNPGAGPTRWWPVAEAPPLAFDHDRILADATERVRSKLEYTTLATRFVTEPFSLKDLYRVYEAVWGSPPDLPNFRRKVLSTNGFVIPVPSAPELLYRRGDADVLQPALLRTAPDEHDERE
jgi:8-oxo-dGTP diphosphatase